MEEEVAVPETASPDDALDKLKAELTDELQSEETSEEEVAPPEETPEEGKPSEERYEESEKKTLDSMYAERRRAKQERRKYEQERKEFEARAAELEAEKQKLANARKVEELLSGGDPKSAFREIARLTGQDPADVWEQLNREQEEDTPETRVERKLKELERLQKEYQEQLGKQEEERNKRHKDEVLQRAYGELMSIHTTPKLGEMFPYLSAMEESKYQMEIARAVTYAEQHKPHLLNNMVSFAELLDAQARKEYDHMHRVLSSRKSPQPTSEPKVSSPPPGISNVDQSHTGGSDKQMTDDERLEKLKRTLYKELRSGSL